MQGWFDGLARDFRQLETASGRLTAYGRAIRIEVAWVRGHRLATVFFRAFHMPTCADAARLTPDERFREVATILAAGVLRLRQRAALPTDDRQGKPPESSTAGLEVLHETVLSVHTG